MFFAGLPLATLLTIGAVAGGLTVVLYILKLKRRPIAVPFSRIWERILRDKEATTLFSQLKRLLSLLVQLALLALVIVALGDPRLSRNVVEGRNIVVLVDASASMKATDVAPSRMDVAKKSIREMVRGLGGSDRMLVAQMDGGLTPLSTMTGEVSDLEEAVEQLEATDTRADFERALGFALDSLRDLSKPEIVVVSDGALGEDVPVETGDVKLTYVPVGEGKGNLAVTGFAVRRYPLDKSRSEVMLEVTNTNEEPAEVELTLLGDGDVIDVTRLKLGPEERLPRFYSDLSGAGRTLEATIRATDTARDALPADDHAYALMPERRRARVAVVTRGNTYLEAALLLDEYLDVTLVRPDEYPPSGSFDVTIFDGVAPPPGAGSGSLLYLDLPGEGGPVEHGPELEMFGFDTWDRKSPVLRWIAMGNVQVATGHALVPEKDDRVLGKSGRSPILVEGRRDGRRFVALGFDPRDSDFVLRVAWPLFLLNTINAFIEEDTGYLSSFRTGEVWRVPAPSTLETAMLVDPKGRERKVPVKEGRAVYLGDQAGFYELHVGGDGEQDTMFAANLVDQRESRIEPAKELVVAGKKAGPLGTFSAGVRRELWIYLLLAAVALSALEWLTYHRRVTV